MKNINWQDDKDIYGRLLLLTNNPIFNNLKNAVDNHNADLSDALSWGQLKSKRWLINELEKQNLDLGIVFICAGWYATLAAMLFNSNCSITSIRSFDIDESCANIAETINKHNTIDNWKFKASTLDILKMNFPTEHKTYRANKTSLILCEMPNTIINTSCEHIENFTDWFNLIPTGKLVALQSNNYFEIDDHVNCVNSLDELKHQAPLSNIIYEGELELEKYTRYMLIGYV